MNLVKISPILFILSILISACQPAEPGLPAEPVAQSAWGNNFTEAPCRMSAPFGVKLTCGMVDVPLDYDRPDGEKIKISVAIAHSKASAPQPDPVIFLPVSPGRSSLEWMDRVTQSLGSILRQHDMIFYDPRGVGHSEPVLPECPEIMNGYYQVFGGDLTSDEQVQEVVDQYLACRDLALQDGFDPGNYTLKQHVADLNAIRVGMGYNQVNLMGSGYAYELALRLLRESSEGVRSVLILSAEDTQAYYSQMSASLERALELIFQRCQENETCSQVYPELALEYYRAVDRYNLQPTPITIRRRGQEGGFEFSLSGHLLIELSRLLMNSSEGIAALPNIIHEIYQERTATLDDSVWWMAMRYGFSHAAADLSANCPAILALSEDELEIQGANPLLAQQHRMTFQMIRKVCEDWFIHPVQPALPLVGYADTPILILQGRYDPALPADVLRQSLQEMDGAQVIELPDLGDVDWQQSCALRLVNGFLQEPEQQLDTRCIGDIPPILFVLPGQ